MKRGIWAVVLSMLLTVFLQPAHAAVSWDLLFENRTIVSGAAEHLSNCDVVGIHKTTGKVYKYAIGDANMYQAVGMVVCGNSGIATSSDVKIGFSGFIKGQTGLTRGKPLCTSTVAGGLLQTEITSSVQQVGIALTTTTSFISFRGYSENLGAAHAYSLGVVNNAIFSGQVNIADNTTIGSNLTVVGTIYGGGSRSFTLDSYIPSATDVSKPLMVMQEYGTITSVIIVPTDNITGADTNYFVARAVLGSNIIASKTFTNGIDATGGTAVLLPNSGAAANRDFSPGDVLKYRHDPEGTGICQTGLSVTIKYTGRTP